MRGSRPTLRVNAYSAEERCVGRRSQRTLFSAKHVTQSRLIPGVSVIKIPAGKIASARRDDAEVDSATHARITTKEVVDNKMTTRASAIHDSIKHHFDPANLSSAQLPPINITKCNLNEFAVLQDSRRVSIGYLLSGVTLRTLVYPLQRLIPGSW